MLSPSSRTPSSPLPPLPPLPSSRTAVAPYGVLRRHMGTVAAVAPLLSGALAWGAGILGGVDPVKAFRELGVPVAVIVLLVTAIAWTYLVFIPQQQAAAEKTRQLMMDAQAAEVAAIVASHADDRSIFQSTMAAHRQSFEGLAEEARQQRGVLEELAHRMGRLEDAIAEVPTSPGTPAHRPRRPLGG